MSNCSAKRDETGYTCRPCGASWVDRTDPPPCVKAYAEIMARSEWDKDVASVIARDDPKPHS